MEVLLKHKSKTANNFATVNRNMASFASGSRTNELNHSNLSQLNSDRTVSKETVFKKYTHISSRYKEVSQNHNKLGNKVINSKNISDIVLNSNKKDQESKEKDKELLNHNHHLDRQ